MKNLIISVVIMVGASVVGCGGNADEAITILKKCGPCKEDKECGAEVGKEFVAYFKANSSGKASDSQIKQLKELVAVCKKNQGFLKVTAEYRGR